MEPAKDKPKGGLALILGGGKGDADSESEGGGSDGEMAFAAFKKALDSGDSAKGFAAFKELIDAADTTEDEPEESADAAEDELDL